jgi:hypothetical protein
MCLAAIIPVASSVLAVKLHAARTSLFVCGIGSMMYHATMSPVWKLADEIPMCMISTFVAVTFVKHTRMITNAWIGSGAALYLFAIVFVDATKVDPSEIAFRTLFIAPFALLVFVNVYLYRRMGTSLNRDEVKVRALQACGRAAMVSALVAGVCWLVDAKACVAPWVAYMQLHTIWHVGVSITCYLLICIAGAMGRKNDILWKWKYVPTIVESVAVEYDGYVFHI